MTTKERFINHIANRLGRERRHGVKPPTFADNPWDRLYEDFSHEDYVQFFIKNLTELGGHAVRAANLQEVSKIVKGIIANEQAKSAILWKDQRFDSLVLYQLLLDEGLDTETWDPELSAKSLIDFAEQADLGITFADMGLAETGSILLFNQGEKGRSVSLLPKVFVTLLRTKDIKPRITSALTFIHDKHEKDGLPSLINFITGPSRSADIEMSLSIGVHGPGIVYVILLDD